MPQFKSGLFNPTLTSPITKPSDSHHQTDNVVHSSADQNDLVIDKNAFSVDQKCAKCSVFRDRFRNWRNQFSVQHAKERCRKVRPSYSCAVLSSGGLLCTLAAIRCGFVPRYGTEIEPKMSKMWSDVTLTPCLGDTFEAKFEEMQSVIYLKSGQPCVDFSSSHKGRDPPGVHGDTGWQYVAQANVIKRIGCVGGGCDDGGGGGDGGDGGGGGGGGGCRGSGGGGGEQVGSCRTGG